MAAPNRILTLDLGTQTVAIAEFQTGKNGGLVLTNYRSTELLADPGADATRLSQARMAIGEMAGGMHLKGASVNYTVSSQAVFTRFVKLPSVGEEQVDQIVTFEAQQNVPFPINEVVWDYQLVDSGSSSEVEVVLVAIKSDLLDDINGAIEEGGLRTNTVDVSPMAIYNAFRYNYSDVSECSLIIDIGARTTNLIFIEPNKIFSRSIPIGGTKITEAIAKDFHEPFGAAEERKKREGFVSLGGTYADPEDPDVARVSKMIRNSMTRLHAEISRSISFYRSQQHGTQPARVFLCGGSASLPYVREFFHEKLQLPVEFFNPLRNVAVGGNLNLDEIGRHAHTLGELVGLALRGISDCPMELNLRPVTVVKRQRLAEQRPYLIMAGTCVLLALAGWWLYYTKAADATAQVLQKIDPQVSELKSYESRMLAVRTDIKKQEETAAPFLQALQERQYWTQVLQDLNSRLPKEFIWITNFNPELPKEDASAATQRPAPRGGARGAAAAPAAPTMTVTLRGLYLDNPRGASVVDDYIQKLSESDLYVVNKEGQVRSVPNESEWAYEWSVPLTLKNPIAAK
jgi:type IV pilus assembly protein PilM